MAKPLTGQVIARPSSKGTTFAVRIYAYGKRRYITLGHDCDGWDMRRAERYASDLVEDIKAGRWEPPAEKLSAAITATLRSAVKTDGRADKAYSHVRKAAQELDAIRTDSFVARRALNEAMSAIYVVEDSLKRAIGAA